MEIIAENICIGFIAAPELAQAVAKDIKDDLPHAFSQWIDDRISWEVEVVVDPLTGSAETVDDILQKASQLKKDKGWKYAICLTDLPIFFGKKIVAADTNVKDGIAQISLPAFGWHPIRKRIKKSVIQLMGELYHQAEAKDHSIPHLCAGKKTNPKCAKNKDLLSKHFPISFVKRVTPPSGDSHGIDVRFLVVPRIIGLFWLILGMTRANRPTSIMSSFKKVIAVAFSTGAFGLIFSTMWKLSDLISLYRMGVLMLAAISGMVVWIIVAHELWENKTVRNEKGLRRLYNWTTVLTLSLSVIIYYAVLFMIFFIAVYVLIPQEIFKTTLELEQTPNMLHYVRLAWLGTSISTIVGAIGAGLENEALVRDITYGYRQKRRYEEVE